MTSEPSGSALDGSIASLGVPLQRNPHAERHHFHLFCSCYCMLLLESLQLLVGVLIAIAGCPTGSLCDYTQRLYSFRTGISLTSLAESAGFGLIQVPLSFDASELCYSGMRDTYSSLIGIPCEGVLFTCGINTAIRGLRSLNLKI